MGTYFNPPEGLPQRSRRLDGETYRTLVSQLQAGEKLFGHYQRPLFQNAVWLYSPKEFEEFEDQVRSGIIARLGFYAMPKNVFEKYVEPPRASLSV